MRKNLLLIISCILCSICFAQNNVIDNELQEVLNQRNDDMIAINIVLKSQINSSKLQSKAEKSLDRFTRREIITDELKEFSSKNQTELMSYLKAEEAGGKVSNINSFWIVNSISCKATKDVIYKLSSQVDIMSISHDKEIQLIDDSKIVEMKELAASRGGSAAPHILQINADDVWAQGYTGKNVIVAVLDSGTNIKHYDLKDHLWLGYIDTDDDGTPDTYVNGWNFIDNNSNIMDDYGHGTHCAGIVCGDGTIGNTVGVAPDATLMTVKIVNRAGGGSVEQMLSGVQFAVENGADVLSISLGFKNDQITKEQKKNIRQAFDNVLSAGVVVCAAAGNDGENYVALENVDYPAACPSPWMNPNQQAINNGGLSSVICVGNVNANNSLVASSSRGPVTWQDVDTYNDYPYNGTTQLGLIRPDICAPGELVYSLKHDQIDGHAYMTGTSQATPSVAGVIALMLEKNSKLTPAQICEIIETTASNKPATKNNQVGSGIVDALAAVNKVTVDDSKPYLKITHQSPSSMASGNDKSINITLANQGKGSCRNGNATLTSDDQYVTITSATTSFGAIAINGTTDVSFTVNLSEETPNGHTAAFTLTSTDGTLTWREDFTIKIDSYAKIVYQSCQTAELVEGENTLSVKMINKGTVATIQNTDVKLTTNSQFVTITDNVSTLETMNVGAEETATFTVTVNEGTPDHTVINFDLYSTPNNYLETRNITYEFESELDEYGSPTDGFNGWTTFDNSADGRNHPWWHSQNSVTHKVAAVGGFHSGRGQLMSETYCQASMQNYTMPVDNFLVSPKIKATSDSEINFFARAHSGFPGERFQVLVSEASNNIASDFTLLSSYVINGEGYDEWKEYTVNLGAYSGKEIYVAIRHYFTSDQWSDVGGYTDTGVDTYILHIDDVTFYDVIDASDNFKYDNYSYFSITVKADPLPAPSNVNATANGTSSINLSWDAVTHAQRYNIYRDSEYIAYTTSTSYSDNNLEHNTQYCYQVAAVYSGYEYEKSASVCATTVQKDYSAAITSVSPQTFDVDDETTIPLKLTITNDGSSQFKARAYYTLSSDNNYVTITNNDADYINALQPDVSVEKTINVIVKGDIPNNSVINFNLNIKSASNQDYEYFEFDVPFSVDVYNPLRAPKNLAANNPGASTIPLTWDAAPNATSYDVYRNGTKIANTSLTIYIDNGLENNTQYCYNVKSVKGNEESDFSDELCVTTLAEDNGIVVQSFNFVENGETATLAVTLVNKTGAATVETTTATLTSEDEYVTIVNGTDALGSIAANGTATAEFTVKLDALTPENHNIAFNITVVTEGMGYGDLQYTFDSDLDGWNTYTQNYYGYNWEHNSDKDCIISYSYRKGYGNSGNISPYNFICSPTKIRMSDKSQIIWDVASSYSGSNSYYKEHYEVYITTVDPTGTTGWEEVGSPIYEATLTASHKNYNFIETTADASSAAGTEVWVVFLHNECTGQDAILVDNIKITNVPMSTSVSYYNSINVTTTAVEPVELTAVANGVDNINLSWNTIARAESYNIYRNGVLLTNTTKTSYTDSNLIHNTTYYYQVVAVSNNVEYGHSDEVSVKTVQKNYSVVFEATPQEIDVLGLTTATISFTIINDGANTIDANYILTCDDTYITIVNGTGNIEALQCGAKVTKAVDVRIDRNVADGSVIAFNLNLSSQNFSLDDAFEITMNNPSRVPENLVVNSSTDVYSLTLSWNAVAGATSYNIYREGEFVANTSSITYSDKGLNAGTNYCYQVSSIIGTVESDLSNEACATTSTMEGQVIVQSYNITEQGNLVTLTATLVNNSDSATPEGTTATLSCNDQYVTVKNVTAEVGALAVNATKEVVFTLELSENTPSNYELNFDVIVEATGSTTNLVYDFNESGQDWYCLDWDGKNGNWEYGTNGYYTSSSLNAKPDNMLISPESVNITANSKLKFDVYSLDEWYPYEKYGVYVTETKPDGGWAYLTSNSITQVYEETLNNADVKNREIDLSVLAGKNVWIMFRHNSASKQYKIVIDNVEITNVSSGGGAGFAHTSSLTVTVNKSLNIFAGAGLWTSASNWSKGSVPTSTDDVIIKGDVIMESGNVIVNSLTIYNGYSLTMNEDTKLTVNGSFVNNNDASLIINDGAQIVQSSENVMATFKMNIENPDAWSDNNITGWQFVATPLKNAKFDAFVPGMNEGEYDLYMYDGSADLEWVNHKSGNTFGTNFEQGVGYLASYEEKETASIYGTLNPSQTHTWELTHSDSKDLANFHLLGNPFSFSMDWSEVKVEGVYNGFAIVDPKTGGYIKEIEGTIPVGDGFFVYATAENPTISYGMRGSRNEKSEYINVVATGKQGSNNVIIKLDGAEEEGFAKLENINKNIADVYIKNNGKQFSILSYDENTTEVELFFDAKEMGNYTINAVPSGKFNTVTLVDRFTGIETNLLLEDYNFTATSGDNHNRFILLIGNSTSSSTLSSNFAYVSGEDLIVNAEGTVQIIDVLGRVVYHNEVANGDNRINVSNFNDGAYFVRVVNENGVKVQKIVL